MDKTINHNGRWVPRFPFPLGSSLEMLEWHQQFKVDSEPHLHCGKRLHNYGKSQCLMGKSTISMTIFNSFLYVYQRVSTFLVSGSFMDTPFGGRWPPGNFPTSCMIKAPLIEEFQMPCLITRGYHRIPYIYFIDIYILD